MMTTVTPVSVLRTQPLFYRKIRNVLLTKHSNIFKTKKMSSQIRAALTRKIADALKCETKSTGFLTQISTLLEIDKNRSEPEFVLNVRELQNLFGKSTLLNTNDLLTLDKARDDLLRGVKLKVKPPRNENIVFQVDKARLIEETLSGDKLTPFKIDPVKTVIIEFSSPNIAKPFHVGHLRSTIIGNFLSNLYEHLGYRVHRLNYLGDWGTQFGYLNVGVEMKSLTDSDIKTSPIEKLYEAYVTANKAAEVDSSIHEKAMSIFRDLENGTFKDLKKWETYREYTVQELSRLYSRLGVKYDEYHWESMYGSNAIQNVVQMLEEQNVLLDNGDGRKIAQVGDRKVPIVKSDGTTLYLTRDIAAYMDRYAKFQFDEMLYVVENGQNDHFTALFGVIDQLKLPYSNRGKHIKFGRIKGMSTRKGTAVFLKDILDEARDIMRQKQAQSKTTKVDLSNMGEASTDILGTSAVIINDLKQKRQNHYDFNWDNALQATGDTGVKLQYTHCRLCSLEENSGATEASSVNPDIFKEQEALTLIFELAKFPEALSRSHNNYEACALVNYLFSLCNSTSKALNVLKIKQEPSLEIRSQRQLLFNRVRSVLNTGMRILGLKPLTKM